MPEAISRNLNLLMEEARINAEELSRRIGIPASTIKKIRNNHDSNPTLSTLIPLAKYFSLSLSQFAGDEPLPKERIKGSYLAPHTHLSQLPLLSWEETLKWPFEQTESINTISSEHVYSQHAFALLVNEQNWENLSAGTVLLIDPTLKAEHRDYIIVHKLGQKLPTLKQVLFDDDLIYLKSVIAGQHINLLTAEHQILGVVVEYKKQLRNKE